MNRIVNARKESRDSDKFIRKTNDDVDEWMDEFYVDGRDASFNLHCLWAWQEQERRHGSLIAEIETLKKDAARYRYVRNCLNRETDILVTSKKAAHAYGDLGVYSCSVLDEIIDEAILKEDNK